MRLFMSYHTPDYEAARRAVDALKAHRPGLDIYFAPRVNLPGAYWVKRLADEIARSDALLYLAGERVGAWQEIEYTEAFRLSQEAGRGGKPRILPVVMAKQAPGLPFFTLHHLIFAADPAAAGIIDLIVKALDGVAPPQSEPWRAFNPYKGLSAFTSADAAYFFGREDLTAQILHALAERPSRALALVGCSGVGKSSVAQAGVLAALKSQSWPGGGAWPEALSSSRSWLALALRPETRPLHNLALSFTRLLYESLADQTAEAMIAEWLTLAEREMNSLLRGWGGGYGNRIDVVKVRMTAFLLRELYEGNVRNAQLKIFNEFANGSKPYIAPGIRQLVGYDQFDVNDVKNNGFPPDAGVGWFALWLTVELNRFPRNIVMIRADKSFGYNQKVIDELTRS